jgi:hypothetical protein
MDVWGKMIMKIQEITLHEREKRNPRIYFFHVGENVLDNLAHRHDRPTELYKNLLEEIFEKYGIDKKAECIWKQKAGCKCGCSPGFVLYTHFDHDIFVDVTE